MTENVETRNKIKNIPLVSSFDELINKSTLKPIEKQLMCMHYLNGNDFRFIGDALGYSESWAKKTHTKALKKLNKIL